jgi:hypothetical protein
VSCFSDCRSLNEIIFEGDCNLKRIDKEAFRWSGLKSIRIPSTVEFIGESCFSDCSLNEVTFEGKVEIGSHAFRDCPLKNVKVPVGVELEYSFGNDCIIEYVGQ